MDNGFKKKPDPAGSAPWVLLPESAPSRVLPVAQLNMQSALGLVTWLEEEDEDSESSDSGGSSTRRRELDDDECDDHVLATIDGMDFNDLTPLATRVAEATDAVPPARSAVKAAAAAIEDADAYAAKTAKHYKAEETYYMRVKEASKRRGGTAVSRRKHEVGRWVYI